MIKYFDDGIIIASDDRDQHIQLVTDLFAALTITGLAVSEEKLQLAQPQIHFLGYNIQYNRILIDEENTIKRWQLPTTKEGLIKFIGFTNFLRQFVPNASNLLKPLYTIAATKNNEQKEALKDIARQNFEEIKEWIDRALMLKPFDPQQPTVIYSDASKEGASAIVFQSEIHHNKTQLFPIGFNSVSFNPTQKRYATVERELWAVINTLEKARLLLSPNITIYTDNQGIISMGRSNRAVHPRLIKYLDVLTGYRPTWKNIFLYRLSSSVYK